MNLKRFSHTPSARQFLPSAALHFTRDGCGPGRPCSADLQSISISGNRGKLREWFGARLCRPDQSQHSRLGEPLRLVQGTQPRSNLAAASPRCAVSQNCILHRADKSERSRPARSPADCKSALQQSATLRYKESSLSLSGSAETHPSHGAAAGFFWGVVGLMLLFLSGHLYAAPAPRVDQVIVVFKTHFDIGYTDFASNVVQRYRTTMIDQALQVVDQNRALPREQQFVWTIPGWPMSKITEDWPGQTSERKQRVLQAFKDGRFAVHALPFSLHTELLEAEDLVRGLGYAARLARAVRLDLPRDAKMTDVPCHSWILPTLLRHAGVDFLHLGCNAASSSPEVPPLFWWEGPDGSRLLTMYSASGYGTGLVPPPDWPHKTWLALIHTGDNHGPPTPGEVKQLLADAAQKLPGSKVLIGRLSDFADALLAEKPNLPVVRGDMPDTWIHGPLCDPAGAKIARNLRPFIAVTEALDTQLRAWGVTRPDLGSTIAKAAEQSLLYGEHTWGGALYWTTSYSAKQRLTYGEVWREQQAKGHFSRLEGSWDEHSAYIQSVESLIRPALANSLEALAGAVRVKGPRIVVYNPLPWRRDGIVTLPGNKLALAALKATDADEIAPVEVHGGVATFFARQVPPMGYRTFIPVEAELAKLPLTADSKNSALESPFFKVTLDSARGVISSLIDKRSGRELVDARAPHGFGQYLYERFDNDHVQAFVQAYVKIRADWATNELGKPNLPPSSEVPYRALSPSNFKLLIKETPLSTTAEMEAAATPELPAVTTKVTLFRHQPYADLEITLHNKAADSWPEAGWLCLPLRVDAPQFSLGRLGSIVDPARDIVSGANHHLLALNTGLTVTDPQGRGVGLCALDSPLVSLDEPGCWKYSRDFVPKRPRVYFNLFNNQWTTNFRLWNSGAWTSRVRLWSVDRYDAETALITPSLEARLPLVASTANGVMGTLPATQSGVELSRRGVSVAALGPDSGGRGMVLRLWEQAGQSGDCQVRLPLGIDARSAQPVDLRDQVIAEPILINEGKFTVALKAFAPVSLRLEMKSATAARPIQTGKGHRFACADYSQGKVFIVSPEGAVEWEHPARSCNDLWMLPNGNMLFTTGHGVKEVTRDKRIVFSYESKSEIYACQRLANGNTFIGECNTGRLLEVAPDGRIVKELRLLPEGKDGGHVFMRNARVLANGHYLVTHYGQQIVREYDAEGKSVAEFPAPGGSHSVVRLPNGHTLIACGDMTKIGNKIIEVDHAGQVVWSIGAEELPGISLKFMTGLHRLPNGNTVISNWLGHGNLGKAPHLIEVTPDKQVVWTFADHQTMKTISSVQILDLPADARTQDIWH